MYLLWGKCAVWKDRYHTAVQWGFLEIPGFIKDLHSGTLWNQIFHARGNLCASGEPNLGHISRSHPITTQRWRVKLGPLYMVQVFQSKGLWLFMTMHCHQYTVIAPRTNLLLRVCCMSFQAVTTCTWREGSSRMGQPAGACGVMTLALTPGRKWPPWMYLALNWVSTCLSASPGEAAQYSCKPFCQ